MTPSPELEGRKYVDAGLIDNAPVRALTPEAAAGPVIVMLNRRTPRGTAFELDGRLYLAPKRRVPIAKWDYSSPQLVRETYEAGQAEAEDMRGALAAYLTRTSVGRSPR